LSLALVPRRGGRPARLPLPRRRQPRPPGPADAWGIGRAEGLAGNRGPSGRL